MAIFILVVLAGLGSFMAVFSTGAQVGSALDVTGTQASFAARSGAEWGAYRAINEASPPCSTGGGTSSSFAVGSFTVTVNCIISGADEAGMSGLFSLTTTACQPASSGACPGDLANPHYVERSLFTLIEK